MSSDPETVVLVEWFRVADRRHLRAVGMHVTRVSQSRFFLICHDRLVYAICGFMDLAATLRPCPLWHATYRTVAGSAAALAITLLTGLGMPVQAVGLDSVVPHAVTLREKAVAYEHGEGVPKDPARAVVLYCEAARLGDAGAQFNLGWMYANGRGVPRDDALAAYFFRAAAMQGDEHARDMLRRVGDPVSQVPDCMREPTRSEGSMSPEFVPRTSSQRRILELVRKLAPEYRVSPRLALAVIRAESNFDARAESPKNAQGLMQLVPETSVRFNVKKPFDPVQNIRGGLAYLRWLLAYFRGDVALVVAAYNAGEGAVDRHRGIPPYAETRDYVRRIRTMYREESHPYDSSIADPSPELPRMNVAAKTKKH